MNYSEYESRVDGLSYVMRSTNSNLVKRGVQDLLVLRQLLAANDTPRARTLIDRIDALLSDTNRGSTLGREVEEVFEDPHWLNHPVVVIVLVTAMLFIAGIYTSSINRSLGEIGKN